MKLGRSKPISPSSVFFLTIYIVYALGRQVARDLRTIWRLTEPDRE